MENLISNVNDRANINNQQILDEITNLCIQTILLSDFEIEIFFDINNFAPNYQRNILLRTISTCSDTQKDQEKNYISLKYQFWTLKTQNHLLSTNGTFDANHTISKEEFEQNFNNLNSVVNQNEYDNSEEKVKCLLLKIAYEIGLYYYYIGNYNEMEMKFTFLLQNIALFSDEYKHSKFYFTEDKVKNLLSYIRKKQNKMQIDDDNNNKLCNVPYKFMFNIETCDNVLNNPLDKYRKEFPLDDPSSPIVTPLHLCEHISLQNAIDTSQNLTLLALNNSALIKDAKAFASEIKSRIALEQNRTTSTKKESKYKRANREIIFHQKLLEIIEYMNTNETAITKTFLTSLSEVIKQNTLTENLRINGLLHGLILNFPNSFSSIFKYFSQFVQFFQESTTQNKVKIVNQIVFISRIVSVFQRIIKNNASTTIATQTVMNINTTQKIDVVIGDDLHVDLIEIFCYWLNQPNDKVSYDENMAFIMVETLKVVEYLYILKIICLGVLKFILEKQQINNTKNTNDAYNEVYDIFYMKNPNLFKVNNLITHEVTYLRGEKYKNIAIVFKEAKKTYKYDIQLIPTYIRNLFILLNKIESKIVRFDDTLTEKDILLRKINLSFLEIIENTNNKNDNKTTTLCNDIVKYLKVSLQPFKEKYFQLDLMSDVSLCETCYVEFKELIHNDVMKKFIYALYLNGKYLEAIVLIQYTKNTEYDLAYKLLKYLLENSSINFEMFQFIWKNVFFEYLSNFYYKSRNMEALNKIKSLIRRISNHQFFKKHPLRKHFKIVNLFKFLDNI